MQHFQFLTVLLQYSVDALTHPNDTFEKCGQLRAMPRELVGKGGK